MAKFRTRRRHVEVTPELRQRVSDWIAEGKSLRWIDREQGIPWHIIKRCQKDSEHLRIEAVSGRRRRSDEFNHVRVENIHGYASGLKLTLDGSIVGIKLNELQSEAVDHWFGWMLDDGTRRRYLTQGVLCMPKRNGKTLLCAVLALAHMDPDGPESKRGANLVVVAENMHQARVLLAYIQDIVDCTPHLADKFVFKAAPRPQMICEANRSTLTVMPGTHQAIAGSTVDFYVIDELALHKDSSALFALPKAQGSLNEPLRCCDIHQVASAWQSDVGSAEALGAHPGSALRTPAVST